MVASNPSLVLNNSDSQQQMSSNYSMPYAPYNASNQSNTSSSTSASLYQYSLPHQQDSNDRYWNTNVNSPTNTKRQEKR